MKWYSQLSLMLLSAAFLFLQPGCKPEDPDDDGELITTVKLTFTEVGTSERFEVIFSDLDGAGGSAPTIDPITMKSNTTYNVQITLLNEVEIPFKDITEEIQAEDDAHIICYDALNGLEGKLNIARTDNDGVYEVGISSRWVTTTAGIGKVRVTLKHQPGVKNGACDPGDTDIEVIFDGTIL